MRPERCYFLDWLRVLAILLVFCNHGLRIVAAGGVGTHDAPKSIIVSGVIWFIRMWVIPLIFLVSGAAAKLSTDVRSSKQFLRERVIRLIVPFIFGVLVLVIPTAYLTRPQHTLDRIPFTVFYLRWLTDVPAGWSPVTFHLWASHLWFLPYLFMYSAIGLCIFRFLRAASGQKLIRAVAGIPTHPAGLLVFALPVWLVHLLLRVAHPSYCDWDDFCCWLLVYVYGFLLVSDKRLLSAVMQQRMTALLAGVLCFAGMLALHLTGRVVFAQEVTAPVYSLWFVVFALLASLNTWSWIAFLTGVSMQYLDFGGKAHRYANEAVLPFYILHVPMLSVASLWVIRLGWGVAATYAALSTISLLGTLVIYEVGVRRVSVVRFLLGMRSARVTLSMPPRLPALPSRRG